MSPAPIPVADHLAVAQQIARSHHLLDDRRWDELVDEVFVTGTGTEPWADFGFQRWVGAEALRAGYAASMARFEAAVHATSNVHLTTEEDDLGPGITASYDVQGWHWLAGPEGSPVAPGAPRPVDFVVLGRMTDRFRRQGDGWRLAHRSLRRLGPALAVGVLPAWLVGLGATEAPSDALAGRP